MAAPSAGFGAPILMRLSGTSSGFLAALHSAHWMVPCSSLTKPSRRMILAGEPKKWCDILSLPGVNKKPEKINTVWYRFWGTFKLFGRLNQANLKLSACFPNTVCWTPSTFFRVATCLIWLSLRDKGRIFFHWSKSVWIGTICLSITACHPNFCLSNEKIFKSVCQGWILSW